MRLAEQIEDYLTGPWSKRDQIGFTDVGYLVLGWLAAAGVLYTLGASLGVAFATGVPIAIGMYISSHSNSWKIAVASLLAVVLCAGLVWLLGAGVFANYPNAHITPELMAASVGSVVRPAGWYVILTSAAHGGAVGLTFDVVKNLWRIRRASRSASTG